MASFMESVNKGITAFSMKTSNFAEVTKCKTYISTLESEIEKLKAEIGAKTYEQHKSGVTMQDAIEDLLTQIDGKYAEIETQYAKIRQMAEEEKQVLGNGEPTPAPTADVIFCSQCGSKNAANYKFCVKCGSPLQ